MDTIAAQVLVDPLLAGGTGGMSWQRFKEMLGFGAQCLNGARRISGVCQCSSKYFVGRLCETILCANDGTPEPPANVSCRCPDAHIRGRFCEVIACENGGREVKGAGGASCKCPYDWYSGRFCETYATPWGVVLGVTITAVVALVIMFIVCRLDICHWICYCCRNRESEDDDRTVDDAERRRSIRRRWPWRRRDRNLRTHREDDAFRPLPGITRNDRTTESHHGVRAALVYLQSDQKPPDYPIDEEPPPPYEAVVRRVPPPLGFVERESSRSPSVVSSV